MQRKPSDLKPVFIPLTAKLGTIERLKEFIRFIIASNGSRKIFREPNVEMAHIAPQVTLICQTFLVPITVYYGVYADVDCILILSDFFFLKVGVMLMAKSLEHDRLTIYKLEDFKQNWYAR